MANTFLAYKPQTVFVMLGNSCNMNCKYCLQHPLVHKALPKEVSPDFYAFLREYNSHEQPLQVHFYGGEPLVYFDTIKKIVTETEGEGFKYSTICNGKAITQEMVDFFNKYDFNVMISWDGKNVKETRGYDVFGDKETKDLLLQIKKLGISSVISSKNYPLEAIQAFGDLSRDYWDIHGYAMNFNYDLIMDTGLPDKTLLDMDYTRVSEEVLSLGKEYLKYRLDHSYEMEIAKLAFIEPYFSYFSKYKNPAQVGDNPWCRCGNGISTLNCDLNGNLYPCHNTSESCGNIKDSLIPYFREVLKLDGTAENKGNCKDCIALSICKGGCKLLNKDTKENTYCKLQKAIASPIIQLLQEFGKTVTKEV